MRRFNFYHQAQRPKRTRTKGTPFILLSAGLMMLAPFMMLAQSYADLSTLDSNALYGNWMNWVPDSGAAENCGGGSTTLTGNDREQKAYNYFIGQGLTPVQAAGILGNLIQEHGLQTSGDAGGLGIAQWTGGRAAALQAYAAKQGLPVTDLGVQLDFLWQEFTQSYASVYKALQQTTSVNDTNYANNSTVQFMGTAAIRSDDPFPDDLTLPTNINGYENPGWPNYKARVSDAQDILKLYGGDAAQDPGAGTTTSDCNGGSSVGGIVPGGGKGDFTTNTSLPAYPGLDAMIARAENVAQTKKASPLPKATADFCASLPDGTCTLHCMAAVGMIWTGGASGYINPNTAWASGIPAKYEHPGDRNPPVGALLFYTAPGDVNGHIAVYMGDNVVFSTDVLGGGSVYLASADLIESAGWNMHYVGWSDPYFNGKVY